MKLTPTMQTYILHWGEMGTRWGVNRTVAQIHALLYLAGKPLPADEISQTLSVARSNVSTSIKELQNWGLVQITHVLGDRRDHFIAIDNTWDMFMIIAEERMRREIAPTLNILRQCVAESERDQQTDPQVLHKIKDMMLFVETISDWYTQMKNLPRPTLLTLIKMGAGVARFISPRKKSALK